MREPAYSSAGILGGLFRKDQEEMGAAGVTDNRITQDEMFDLFGERMPIEAAELLYANPDNLSLQKMRVRLREMSDKEFANRKRNKERRQ